MPTVSVLSKGWSVGILSGSVENLVNVGILSDTIDGMRCQTVSESVRGVHDTDSLTACLFLAVMYVLLCETERYY